MLKLDRKSTCLLIIDMQNGFCHKNGTLAKFLDVSPCTHIIPNIRKLVDLCRKKRVPILYAQQEHLPEDKDAVRKLYQIEPTPGSHIHSRSIGSLPCMKGTWDAQIVDELKPRPKDYVIKKQKFSVFYGTNLEVLLRIFGVRTIIVTGVNTNVCVESTIRDAYFRDYVVVAVKEGIAAPTEQLELHKATLRNIEQFLGWVFPLTEVADTLEKMT